MTDQEVQDIVNRVIEALHGLAPLPPAEPSLLTVISSLAPIAALVAAAAVTIVGLLNLKHQQTALKATVQNDDRSEWWKRAQWALESASDSENDKLNAAGTEMLKLLVTSKMASNDDKDLLDTAWKAGTGAVSQDAAEDAIAEAAAFNQAADLDEVPETSENEGTKEATHG